MTHDDLKEVNVFEEILLTIPRPDSRITNQCTSQRLNIMQRMRGILRHAKSSVLREVKVHLGRCFGPRGNLKKNFQGIGAIGTTDVIGISSCRRNVHRGRDQRTNTGRCSRFQPVPWDFCLAIHRTCIRLDDPLRFPHKHFRLQHGQGSPQVRIYLSEFLY